MPKQLMFCLLLTLAGLVACARDEQAATVQPTMTATAVVTPTMTATPRPTATPTPTPEPTPIAPAITVTDQVLTEDGRLIIDRVTVPESGWLVIHAERDGQVSEVLGHAAVEAGVNEDVEVTIDPLQASPRLVAMLHVDAGDPGVYEFPGPDEPWQMEATVVSLPFAVDIQVMLPYVTVADQEVLEDGLVRVANVFASRPGWLLIHAGEGGAVGPVLGWIFVEEGLNENLLVSIPWRIGTPRLYAVLYEDRGRPQRLDYPGEDVPVLVNSQPIVAPFQATYPPDILVYDQPVVNGQVVIDRVISNGLGWLVVYYDDNGRPGLIIGSAPLADGLNEQVVVPVIESAVTSQLHVMVHEDTNPEDSFAFPRADPPITYHGRMVPAVAFRTAPGNYLIVREQSLNLAADGGVASVVIPLVVVHADSWVALYADADGAPGGLIGLAHAPAGVNRDLLVEIAEPAQATETLYAVLHADLGTPAQFDYPGGPDVPLRRNQNVIQVLFKLLP